MIFITREGHSFGAAKLQELPVMVKATPIPRFFQSREGIDGLDTGDGD